MNTKNLAEGARDLAAKITDAELAKDPVVARLTERLADARIAHREAVESLQGIEAEQDVARRRVADALAEIEAIEAARPTLAKAILRGESHDDDDARQQSRVADLRRVREVFTLALLAFEADVTEAQRCIRLSDVGELSAALEERRDAVRAEMAMARWTA
ncbi:MAG: hypothetical protein JNM61_08745 [Zoogloeaceae bacterium]|nr:hypothetical protein [Zoogloeaceae bacterium]